MDKPRMLVLDPHWQDDHAERLEALTNCRFNIVVCNYFTRESIKRSEIAVLVDMAEVAKQPPQLIICELEMPCRQWGWPSDFYWGMQLLESVRRHPQLQMPVIAVCERLPKWLMEPSDHMTRLRLSGHWRLAAFVDRLTGRESHQRQFRRLNIAGLFTWDELNNLVKQNEFRGLVDRLVPPVPLPEQPAHN